MRHKPKEFWLALLNFGDSLEEQRLYWNGYFAKIYSRELYNLLKYQGKDRASSLISTWQLQHKEGKELESFLKDYFANYDDKSEEQNLNRADREVIVNFSGHTFENDTSFAHRVLMEADFSGVTFKENADFRAATFTGLTNFSEAKFEGEKSQLGDGTRFDNTEFHNTVYFNSANFNSYTDFSKSRFNGAAYFKNAKFVPKTGHSRMSLGTTVFNNSNFISEVRFTSAQFGVSTGFRSVEFKDNADFSTAEFEKCVFDNAVFEAKTSFRGTVFNKAPEFFETKLHENTDFNNVDWNRAKLPHIPFLQHASKKESDELVNKDIDEAIRAWDRLALIMSELEKPQQQQVFYKLRMRAQRKRDGWTWRSLVSYLFDGLSDYGWSIGRASLVWVLHIVIGTVILCLGVSPYTTESNCGPVLLDSFLVSLANSHSFLGLTSRNGYLSGVRECLDSPNYFESIVNMVGATQAFVGPILLFLLVLTLRNRFRLG